MGIFGTDVDVTLRAIHEGAQSMTWESRLETYVPKFDSVDELLAWLARGEQMTEQEVPQGSPVPPPDEPVVAPDLVEPEDEGEVDNGADTEQPEG